MAKSQKSQVAAEGENTVIWNRCSTTPSEYLKAFKRGGGFSGKSIDPTYRIRLLTELFGPCGVGWGFVQEDQWSDGGSGAYVVYVRGHLWYMHEGERRQTMSHTGGTVADRAPDEVYKMAETDSLGKCCLDLGVGADVYMGLHDGDKYQDERPATYSGNPEAAGRRAAGRAPSNAPAAAVAPAAIAIVEAEVSDVIKAIEALADDVEAYDYSRKLFSRMLLSSNTIPPEVLGSLAERLATKRATFVTEASLPIVKKTLAAYVKQGWVTKATSEKIIALCERKLGIAPIPGTKE